MRIACLHAVKCIPAVSNCALPEDVEVATGIWIALHDPEKVLLNLLHLNLNLISISLLSQLIFSAIVIKNLFNNANFSAFLSTKVMFLNHLLHFYVSYCSVIFYGHVVAFLDGTGFTSRFCLPYIPIPNRLYS